MFVTTVDGINGIITANGAVDLKVNATGTQIGVQQPIATGNGNVTLTANDVEALAVLPARSVAVAESTCGPSPKAAAEPAAPGQDALAMPESASDAAQLIATLWSTV